MRAIVLSCLAITFPFAVWASEFSSETPKWGTISMGLFGGLALFLYGMEMMSDGMKKGAGKKMRSILAALTKNRIIAMIVGAFVTMVIQSSSATTVMLVSFVQAELMRFSQTLAVILGADIGTTVTAQLVAFKLTDYAMLMIAIGFALRFFAKKEIFKHLGEAVLGFGILFFGMKLMSEAMYPLRSYSAFIDGLRSLEHPLMGIIVGAGFTALIQSSSAFTGIVIVLAQQNLIGLEAGIPLIMGANIGTCITAALASIGAGREAKRVAIAHAMFKVSGVLLFIFWIPTFAKMISDIGIYFEVGSARNIANAHTIFNVSLALFFLPFTRYFALIILKIFPDKPEEKGLMPAIWHLDEGVLSTPDIAIELTHAEITRMAKIVGRMVDSILPPFIKDPNKLTDKHHPHISIIEGIEMRENKLDFLEEKVSDYLLRIGRKKLSKEQSEEVYRLLSIVKDMESIGDIIHKNMIPQMKKKHILEKDFSKEGKSEISTYHKKIHGQMDKLENVLSAMDRQKAAEVMQLSKDYAIMEEKFRKNHLKRVKNELAESMITHEVHMELMDLMKQINTYVINIARSVKQMEKREEALPTE
jgi:phosphate:Na+ symporter